MTVQLVYSHTQVQVQPMLALTSAQLMLAVMAVSAIVLQQAHLLTQVQVPQKLVLTSAQQQLLA
jgi:hypothetical protein